MQPIAAVGDVGGADVLARRQQVLNPARKQRPERDLERQTGDVDVVVAARARVQIDAVVADPDGVLEGLRPWLRPALPGILGRPGRIPAPAHHGSDVRFRDRPQCPDAAGLADVRRLGEPAGRAGDVGAWVQAGIPAAPVRPGPFGLQPVEQAERELTSRVIVAPNLLPGPVDDAGHHVVVVRPVEDRRLIDATAARQMTGVDDPPIAPPAGELLAEVDLVLVLEERGVPRFQRRRCHLDGTQQRTRPRRGGRRRVGPPGIVVGRPIDGVVRAGPEVVTDRQTPGERLHVMRLRRSVYGVLLTRIPSRFGAGGVLDAGKRQEVAELGCIDDDVSADRLPPTRAQLDDGDRLHPVSVRGGRHGHAPQAQVQEPGGARKRKQLFEHGNADPRFVAQPGHGALAGVEKRICPRRRRQRVVVAVVLPDSVPIATIARRTALPLDPWALIRGHHLRGELTADPVGLLGHDHLQPEAGRCQGRRATARAPTDDQQVGMCLCGCPSLTSGTSGGLHRLLRTLAWTQTRAQPRTHRRRAIELLAGRRRDRVRE